MNPRYLEYCRAHGRGPEAMLVFDRERAPGGHMGPFILWIGARWQEWDRGRGLGPWASHSAENHRDFDAWLPQQVDARLALVRLLDAARADGERMIALLCAELPTLNEHAAPGQLSLLWDYLMRPARPVKP